MAFVAEADLGMVGLDDLKVVSKRQPTKKSYRISYSVGKWQYVKSNAIVYAKNNQTIGIGADPDEPCLFSENCRY
ncbi:hypothetical protein INT80_05290 [Gallibacterium anatis]|uniref:Uncharacterized protein n=1 Tax=Gallibacterium anatis TaxID=750 RepID=A0A930UWM8_9PAST|nr:hypothetical protein [Gallibacterium anatis]